MTHKHKMKTNNFIYFLFMINMHSFFLWKRKKSNNLFWNFSQLSFFLTSVTRYISSSSLTKIGLEIHRCLIMQQIFCNLIISKDQRFIDPMCPCNCLKNIKIFNIKYEARSHSFAHLSMEIIYRGWGYVQNYSGNLWGLL